MTIITKSNLTLWVRILFLFVVLFFGCAKQQETLTLQKTIVSKDNPDVKIQLFYNKTNFSLWETWQVKFVFNYPDTYQIQGKYLNFTDYQPLSLYASPIEETNFNNKQNSWTQSLIYLLEAPKSGDFILQERDFVLVSLITSKKLILKTPAIPLKISTTISNKSSLRAIKNELNKDSNYKYYIALVLAILLGITCYFWKNKKLEIDKITITKWALKELKKLQKNDLITIKDIKYFHLELSKILRVFFEGQFGIKSTAQTKEEFLQEICKNKKIKKDYKHLLEQYLELNELAKFANYKPSAKNNSEIFALVKKIITFYHKQHQK